MPQNNYDDLLAEADIYALIERLNGIRRDIERAIPRELIYKENGEPNVHTRWGAIIYHMQYMRATFISFLA